MAKPGNLNNRKRCERYKNSGRREENKKIRQARDEKRRAKFAQRREDGKVYNYTPNPYKEGTSEYNKEVLARKEKTVSKKTEWQRIESIMRKLQNEIEKKKKLIKNGGGEEDVSDEGNE